MICWVKVLYRVLEVTEGRFRVTCAFMWNCLLNCECHCKLLRETGITPHIGAPTLVTAERHMEQVKSDLHHTKRFHAWQLLQKSQALQQEFTVSTPTAWGNKKSVQSGFYMCLTVTAEPSVFFLPPLICSFGERKAVHLLYYILTFDGSWMHSFNLQLKKQITEWPIKKSLRKKIVQVSQGALKVMHIIFLSRNDLVFDHPVLTGATVSG